MSFMDSGLAPIGLDALIQNVRLDQITAEVLGLGIELGVITSRDAMNVEMLRLSAGLPLRDTEVEVALLLSQDIEDAKSLLDTSSSESGIRNARRIWAFVGAQVLRQSWSDDGSSKEQLAALIEALGDPAEYSALVYFRPLRAFRKRYGDLTFLEALDSHLAGDQSEFGQTST
jgi:hypothetical protein